MVRQRAEEGCVILMMACLAEDNKTDAEFLEEHLNLVRGTQIPVFWVDAHCDPMTLEERLRSPESCREAKTKLTNVRVLKSLLREHRLIEPNLKFINEAGGENLGYERAAASLCWPAYA